jgi:hypothetical protein
MHFQWLIFPLYIMLLESLIQQFKKFQLQLVKMMIFNLALMENLNESPQKLL